MTGYTGADTNRILKQLNSDPRVEYAEPDYYYHTMDHSVRGRA